MTPFDNSEFEKEAKEKWGHTQAYREYEEKHHSQPKQDAPVKEIDRIMAEFALCMQKGNEPNSDEAQRLVKTLQDHITRNYYRCTEAILAGLGQMYVADPRFKNNINKHAEGTASFICDAITTYCCK